MLSAAGSRRARSLPPGSIGAGAGSGALSGILSGSNRTRFGPLRPALSRPKDSAMLGRGRKAQRYPMGSTRRTNGLHKMETLGKKRSPDYTDMAYREAVSRLRYLLAESYTSPHRSPFRGLQSQLGGYSVSSGGGRLGEDSGEETDALSERSRALLSPYRRPVYTATPRRSIYTPGRLSKTVSVPLSHVSNQPTVHVEAPPQETAHTAPTTPRGNAAAAESAPLPPEMMAYIERQEEYIDQLERESHFCRDELSTLLGKVKEVISENEGLHEKQKSGMLKSVFDYLQSEGEEDDDEDDEREDHVTEVEPRKKKRETSVRRRLEGPNIVFESRISELEAQLTQVRIDLKKSQDEADIYKRRLAGEGLLSDLAGGEPDSLRQQFENLKREKDELAENLSKLQSTVSQLRERESDATHRLKRSQEAVEQAQFEKSQSELEVRRLKDELDRLHGKLREAVAEQGRRAADERAGVERRFQQQVDSLQADLTAQWDASGRLQLELEKQRRVEAELRREVANKNASLEEMAKETQAKIDVLQAELSSALSQQSNISQELSRAQMQADRAGHDGQHESKKLSAEVSALRDRLDRADSETLRARQEALRLSEQLDALNREITLNKSKGLLESSGQSASGDQPSAAKEKELTTMITNMETKHVETVAELEGMIQSQNQVMAKLKDECHSLTQRLEDSSTRHKAEMAGLQSNIDYLTSKMEASIEAQGQRDMEASLYADEPEPVDDETGLEPTDGGREYQPHISVADEYQTEDPPYEASERVGQYQTPERVDNTYQPPAEGRRMYEPTQQGGDIYGGSERTDSYKPPERGGNYETNQNVGKQPGVRETYQPVRVSSRDKLDRGPLPESTQQRAGGYDSAGSPYKPPERSPSQGPVDREPIQQDPSQRVAPGNTYQPPDRAPSRGPLDRESLQDPTQRVGSYDAPGYQQQERAPVPTPLNRGPSQDLTQRVAPGPYQPPDRAPSRGPGDREPMQDPTQRVGNYDAPGGPYQPPDRAPSRGPGDREPMQDPTQRVGNYDAPGGPYQPPDRAPSRGPGDREPLQDPTQRVGNYDAPGGPYQPPDRAPSRGPIDREPMQDPTQRAGGYDAPGYQQQDRTPAPAPLNRGPSQDLTQRVGGYSEQPSGTYQSPPERAPSRGPYDRDPSQDINKRAGDKYEPSYQESDRIGGGQYDIPEDRNSSYDQREPPPRVDTYQPPQSTYAQEPSVGGSYEPQGRPQAPTYDAPSERGGKYQPPPTAGSRSPTTPTSPSVQSRSPAPTRSTEEASMRKSQQ